MTDKITKITNHLKEDGCKLEKGPDGWMVTNAHGALIEHHLDIDEYYERILPFMNKRELLKNRPDILEYRLKVGLPIQFQHIEEIKVDLSKFFNTIELYYLWVPLYEYCYIFYVELAGVGKYYLFSYCSFPESQTLDFIKVLTIEEVENYIETEPNIKYKTNE